MQNLFSELQKKVIGLISENASAILTAGGVVGTVATAVLTGRAAVQASSKLQQERTDRGSKFLQKTRNESVDISAQSLTEVQTLTRWEKVQLTGVYFIPPVFVGGATIASIVMSNRISAQKAAALAAAYGLAEGRLTEYKEKMSQALTPAKEKKLQDELAQERVNRTPGHSSIIVVDGEVRCFDQPTGRYFRSSMEAINRAVNATNSEIIKHQFADASFFYSELGLEPTTWTNEVGWSHPTLVELDVSAVVTPDDQPCLAIDFKVMPTTPFDYR